MLRSLTPLTLAAALAGGAAWATGLPGAAADRVPQGLTFPVPDGAVTVDLSAGPDPVTVAFPVENRGDRPVTIHGVRTGCGCVAADDLPLTVPPGTTAALRFLVDPARLPADGSSPVRRVTVYTDAGGRSPVLTLAVGTTGELPDLVLAPTPDPLFQETE